MGCTNERAAKIEIRGTASQLCIEAATDDNNSCDLYSKIYENPNRFFVKTDIKQLFRKKSSNSTTIDSGARDKIIHNLKENI